MSSNHSACPTAATTSARAAAVVAAAERLLVPLAQGVAIERAVLRDAMTEAFGASDAEGAWDWKLAYDACEVAQVLFLRRHGAAIARRAPAMQLAMLSKVASLIPTHTRRSEESQAFQQFSTPLPLAFVAARAASLGSSDVVLEPSAGTGLLAIFAETAGAALALNELADGRADLLGLLFDDTCVTQLDAAHIHDRLDEQLRPSVVLMNPPFSVAAHVDGTMRDAANRHIASALARLAEGGRLVAITGAGFAADDPAWANAFAQLAERGRVVFSAALHGSAYARHGTTVATRLTVIDRATPGADISPAAHLTMAADAAALLALVEAHVPPRAACIPRRSGSSRAVVRSTARSGSAPIRPFALAPVAADAIELEYEIIEAEPDAATRISDALYEPFTLQTVRLSGAAPHPTPLVQSAAMASVRAPRPSYRPHLPAGLVVAGLLSDAQLETLVLAGEAHSAELAGAWQVDETFATIAAAAEDADGAVRFRRGFMLGDGTGAGKGRQVAAVILDNWLKGRRRALWISKSDTLIEDAQRDWAALGQERLLIQPLSRFRQGKPITLPEGILFATYATLRSDARDEKVSRVTQIVDWLGSGFDGVIVFDESHAMQNAAGVRSERGDTKPSQQGRAGLSLQHALPQARVLYVSATGATTVHNLAYAQRLGLWGGEDFPFVTRAEFVAAIETGGVAAMEVLARDLRALGLYTARSLSYDGIEYEIVEHALTPEQTRIYDAYAGAFQIIHHNLDAALEAAGVTSASAEGSATLNAQAKSAARSAFESSKQRFFGHLLTSMKTPTLIARIDEDLAAGHACVVQIVSTGEALMTRRIAAIPAEDWCDVQIDITPREYVLDYLAHAFPVQLYEPFTDGDGNLASRPVYQDGHPLLCRDAVDRRDRLIERLAALPPVAGALDQIVQRFGTDEVAEVTGRTRRIVRRRGSTDIDRLAVETRPAGSNLAETAAFQDDAKRILIFSEAGGTGRSYHADLSARNTRLRVHYLLEAGWKADAAIQGLGRTNRTHQAQPPVFRPIATNVRGEKRFLSTIARRLDTLGAITRGQRQTGGQGLFRASDNLESDYARAALRQLYMLLIAGKVESCSLGRFEDATGLALLTRDGAVKEDLPPITQFLNRVLALPIALQNLLFDVFDGLLNARVENAVAAGTYDIGLETLRAESMTIIDRRAVYTHPGTGAETFALEINRLDRIEPYPLDDALDLAGAKNGRLLVNAQSGHAAVQVGAASVTLDDGTVEKRVRLVRPTDRRNMAASALDGSLWQDVDGAAFAAAWTTEVAALPPFVESRFWIVTGLLLPIWRRLPQDGCRVYRLQTDDGARIIGRRVSADWVAQALGEPAPAIATADAWETVFDRNGVLQLEQGMTIRRSLVMGSQRVELTGFGDAMVERLKADGLITEIIAWKLRAFVPVGADGPATLARVLAHYPIVRVVDRVAA
ncbi:strawberry notch family protein [Sphingomonas donggukensis]|uniref:Strawberry notch family protein n=1 Tax=Sphingomonas donggukensis TaxID=2949093 RepID=A0ABY4U003_9SPHN|nr:strawberry notch family protein [Sphingomonas donggukensis]URW75898.1 strawberry notch family protein [Sphingomonas donggukensis]